MAPILLLKKKALLLYWEAGTPVFSMVGGLAGRGSDLPPQSLAPRSGLGTGASLSSSTLSC